MRKLLPVIRRATTPTMTGTPDRLRREEIYLALAELWASRSVCRRLQVGAVITDKFKRRVLAVGYNGPARGLSHARCSGEEGYCGCIHAEANAIVKADNSPGKVMFVTTAPCGMCAQLIIQAGIVAVHTLGEYRDTAGVDLLREVGIKVYQWSPCQLHDSPDDNV